MLNKTRRTLTAFITAIVFFVVISSSSIANAQTFKLTTPKDDNSLYFSKNIVVSGIADEFDTVNIDLYKVDSIDQKVESIAKPYGSYFIKVDALEIFAQEIEVKPGITKAIITHKSDNKTNQYLRTIVYMKNVEKDMNKILVQTLDKK